MSMSRDNMIENFSEYKKTITNYVEKGIIPSNITKDILLTKIGTLSPEEKQSLRESIEWKLPMDHGAYYGPLLKNAPTAATWSVLVGISGGFAQYKVTNEPYLAVATGLLAGTATFFGQQNYKQRQVKTLWDHRIQRANEFLAYLPGEPAASFKI